MISSSDKLLRRLGFALLILGLGTQALLVYSDQRGHEPPPLSDEATIGKSVFQRNNCQACHQIFGFGGFLGPDLTNVVPPHTPGSLAAILSSGPGAMPSFSLTPDETLALSEYLKAMNRLGVSQPRSASRSFVWSDIPWFEYRRPAAEW